MEEQRVVLPSLKEVLGLTPPLSLHPRGNVSPSDLTKFAPFGTGFYGYQEQVFSEALRLAPRHEPCGGVVYFERINREEFSVFVRQMFRPYFINPQASNRRYVAFAREAEDPKREGYLRQLRIVSHHALVSAFGAVSEEEWRQLPEQEMTDEEAFWAFIEDEREYWNGNPDLDGAFGGDGNLEEELLSFGMMVENSYFGIYRIWSRAWLITK